MTLPAFLYKTAHWYLRSLAKTQKDVSLEVVKRLLERVAAQRM